MYVLLTLAIASMLISIASWFLLKAWHKSVDRYETQRNARLNVKIIDLDDSYRQIVKDIKTPKRKDRNDPKET